MVGFEDALALSLLLSFYAYIFIRPGRSVRSGTTQQTLIQIVVEVEMHGCILHSELIRTGSCLMLVQQHHNKLIIIDS